MSRLVSPRFVGREAELRLLLRAFDDAVGGTPGAVLVGAEAGGGKSRLVREFTDGLGERALVLVGGCVELSAAGLPYAPFVAALRGLVRDLGVAEVGGLVEDPAELARLLPDFGPVPSGDPEAARARLFEVLLRLVENLARRTPLVLVVEDLHWADAPTRDLLMFLVANLHRVPVLLVVTFRSDELHTLHPLRPVLAELGRLDGVTTLTLPRLSLAEVAAQLAGILGRPAEPAVVSAVHRGGDGVPLFTEAMLGADGVVRVDVPGSLRDLLLGAVRDLPEAAQAVVRTVAVCGVRVGHGLLAAVTEPTGLGPALGTALRQAIAANVLVGDGDGYAFRHALIRRAVDEDLLAGERVEAHLACARALAADPALGGQTWVSVALARHWLGAGDAERALDAAWQAAGEARAGLAYVEQLRMLEQVLTLWESAPQAATGTDADHAGVLELAADAACWAAESTRALELVEAALAELREPERIAGMLVQRAAVRQQLLLPGEVDDLLAALKLAAGPSRLRAEILGQLCRSLDPRRARPFAEELTALAEELDDDEFRTEAVITTATDIATLRAAGDSARRIGNGRLEVLAAIALTDALGAVGEHRQVIETGRSDLARAVQLGQARYRGATIAGNLATALTAAGRWDEALDVVGDAVELDPAPFELARLLLCRARIAIARGDLDATDLRDLGALPAGAHTLALAGLEFEHRLAAGEPVDVDPVLASLRDAEPRQAWPVLATLVLAAPQAARSAATLPCPGPVEQAYATVVAADDQQAWDDAADAWAALAMPYQQANALFRAAAAGARDTMATRLRAAADLAGSLGAGPLLAEITALARRARVELTPDAAPRSTPFRLTGRELEVLRLVTAGRSNREIAADLFITAKTASVHVSNILGKLGVHSRGEAAAAAHRLGLV